MLGGAKTCNDAVRRDVGLDTLQGQGNKASYIYHVRG